MLTKKDKSFITRTVNKELTEAQNEATKCNLDAALAGYRRATIACHGPQALENQEGYATCAKALIAAGTIIADTMEQKCGCKLL